MRTARTYSTKTPHRPGSRYVGAAGLPTRFTDSRRGAGVCFGRVAPLCSAADRLARADLFIVQIAHATV